MDVVRLIQTHNAGRDPVRLAMKYRSMRTSAFTFLRGTCHLFYEQFPRGGIFKSAPLSWACGDLHLENFGSYKGDNRLVYFDINDFDEAALAPATWDVVRLLSSLHVWADEVSLSDEDTAALCQTLVDTYASELSQGKAYWIERETAQGPVHKLLDTLRDRQRADFLNRRTVTKGKKRLLLVDGERALPVSDKQRKAVNTFMEAFAQEQENPKFFKLLDVANRVAGTGSLGIDRYVILVHGKGSPDGNYLLDLKESLPSSLVPQLKAPQPKWKSEAHRIVELQKRMQAVSMAFLHTASLNDERAYVLRGLQPTQDRVMLTALRKSQPELQQLVRAMARLLAWAQLRSAGRDGSANADELIDFAQRKKWRDKLLTAAKDCAAQVHKDAAQYNAAYDEGDFNA